MAEYRPLDPPDEERFSEICSVCLIEIRSEWNCKIVFDDDYQKNVIKCNKCNNEHGTT